MLFTFVYFAVVYEVFDYHVSLAKLHLDWTVMFTFMQDVKFLRVI
jgi:hypothetical protein